MAIKTLHYASHTFKISYEILNPDARHDIIFLHGWGSNKELMKKSFAPYLDSFRHIYIDLPGFGNSTCDMALDSEAYATIMESFFALINAQREIIVGHSFGAKVATRLNPELLVLIGAAGIPVSKPLKVRAKIALFKLLKPFGGAALRAKFAAADAQQLSQPMYETFKNVVNEDFTDYYRRFGGHALLCWGREDSATPLHTAHTMHKLIGNSDLVEFEGDHYFFMTQADGVAKAIETSYLKMMEH